MANINGTLLPELSIFDPDTLEVAPVMTTKSPVRGKETSEAVQQLLFKLSIASKEASSSETLVEGVRAATYNMVGFGPMLKALEGRA